MLNESIRVMTDRIMLLLADNNPAIHLFGSVVLNDFRLGWSDIDMIVLTKAPISERQADELVNLRQTLTAEYNGNPYFRLFEGGILSQKAFFTGEKDTVVYWGTSGQRITDNFQLDSFARAELPDLFPYPPHEQFKADIRRHYTTIRQYAQATTNEITSCGWLLDIARGLYTLRTDKVIAKTAAGEWAVEKNLAPDADILQRAVQIRKTPLDYAGDAEALEWCGALGPHIQEFADVLERELKEGL